MRLPDGRKILEAERNGLGAEASLENTLPRHADDELVVSFALAVVGLRITFRACPLRTVHDAESRAEGIDDLLDGDDAGDGGE